MSEGIVPGGGSLARRIDGLRRSRLGLAILSLVCGLGIAASGVTFVRAADDGGLLDFFRGSVLDRIVDPFRLRPRYDQPSGFVYRPERETRRREARRHAIREARRAEIRRAAPRRPSGSQLADARRPRPGLDAADRADATRPSLPEVSAATATATGRRTMCVRTCDGYLFPIGILHARRDLDMHQTACSAACPGAETRLYTLAPGQRMDDPSGARSVLDGTVYGRMKTAFLFRQKTVASCECQPADRLAHLPILLDPTLRRGDVVVDGKGEAKAFAGAPRRREAFGDYERSAALTPGAKAKVDRLMGTSVRRRIAADFERNERRRLAGALPGEVSVVQVLGGAPGRTRHASVTPIRETPAPAGSGAGVRAYSFGQGGMVHASGARIYAVQ